MARVIRAKTEAAGTHRRRVENAVRQGLLDHSQAGRFVKFYEDALHGYTYLEEPGE